MIRKLISVAISVLLLVSLAGCGTDLESGIKKEFEDNKDGIRQELSRLWDSFLEELNEWSNSLATHSITKDHDLIGDREKVPMIMSEHMRPPIRNLMARNTFLEAHHSNARMAVTCTRLIL